MFTLQKLALLIAVLSAVWGAYKFIGNMERSGKAQETNEAKKLRQKSQTKTSAAPTKAEKTIECHRCGTYVAAGSRPVCSDKLCPFPVRTTES